jgi:D-glycero-alpha-D-manno-heptose-7-phosphate kinase
MIITRTPFRITLGGGGTDLPSYYKKYGGFLISAAINKYMYITVNQRFEESIRVSYSKTETVNKISDIEHPIVREALNLLDIKSGMEITSIADLPSGSGVGSSGSFTVGLLNALHAYKREYLTPKELAEEAFYVEAEILNEPVGKQDQYIAAYGGLISMDIDRNGEVTVDTQVLSEDIMDQFESNTLFFYTGLQRKASEILSQQTKSIKMDENAIINSMHQIKEIGRQCLVKLKKGDVDWFGKSLDLHWNIKKQISPKMTDKEIDRWYKLAIQNGALGGKIIGAGGGGFFIFYCSNINNKSRLRQVMAQQGLKKEVRLKIDYEGSKVLLNI